MSGTNRKLTTTPSLRYFVTTAENGLRQSSNLLLELHLLTSNTILEALEGNEFIAVWQIQKMGLIHQWNTQALGRSI